MEKVSGIVSAASVGLLWIALGFPLATRKIKPNFWYGMRINNYVSMDEDIWYAVNAEGGRDLVKAGLACLVLALVAIFFAGKPGAQTAFLYITVGIICAGLASSTYQGFMTSFKMAEEKGLRQRRG